MQILSAALAFAITMLILSLVTNVLVETFHRLLRMRSVGLKLMLGHLFDRVIAPLLSGPDGAVSEQQRAEFINMMTVNRAPTGTAFRGDISRTSDGQATGEGDEGFFRWPWNGRRLDKLSVEGFMARLGGSGFSDEIRAAGTGSVAGLDLVLADIGQKFADFGNEASLFFQQRARFTAVVISVLVAWFVYVHPYDIFSTFLRDPEVTDAVIALQDATLTEFEAQKADLTASQAALAKAEEEAAMAGGDAASEDQAVADAAAEVTTAREKLEDTVDILQKAGVPIGWTDTKMTAVGFCKKSPFGLFDLPYPCTGAGFTTAIWLILGGFLVGLGGPFWYDLVKSLSSIRSVLGAGGAKAGDPAPPGQNDTSSSALKSAIDHFKVSAAGRDAVMGAGVSEQEEEPAVG